MLYLVTFLDLFVDVENRDFIKAKQTNKIALPLLVRDNQMYLEHTSDDMV
jgi:hypothetical protein